MADVRVDLREQCVTLDGQVLTVREVHELRRKLSTALNILDRGYTDEPKPGDVSFRTAREFVPSDAPRRWKPGMRPVLDQR